MSMECAKQPQIKRIPVYMTQDEASRFQVFLEENGHKASTFLRAKAISAVKDWESKQEKIK